MDTDSFIINIKTEGFYEYIAGDVEKILDTSDVNSIGHYLGGSNWIDERQIREKDCNKIYSYLMDDGNSGKKAKGTKTV